MIFFSLSNKYVLSHSWMEVTICLSRRKSRSVSCLTCRAAQVPISFLKCWTVLKKSETITQHFFLKKKKDLTEPIGFNWHPWMIRGDFYPLVNWLTSLQEWSWMTRGEEDSCLQIFSSLREGWSKAYSVLWPFCYFSVFLFILGFNWKELGILLHAALPSPVQTQICYPSPWPEQSWSGLLGGPAKETKGCSHRQMQLLGRADRWPHVHSWSLSSLASVSKHP